MPNLSTGQMTLWVLVAIVVIILIGKALTSKKNVSAQPVASTPQVPAREEGQAISSNVATDAEIIAVISAAVAAMSGIMSTYNLQIKSIKRQGQRTPIWNAVSRKENLDSRF